MAGVPFLILFCHGRIGVGMDWLTKAAALMIAVLCGYFYAATRNWVWYPEWLKRFVLGEKKR